MVFRIIKDFEVRSDGFEIFQAVEEKDDIRCQILCLH